MFAELAAAAAGALGTAVGTDAWKWITGSVKALFQKAGTSEAAVEKWLEDTTADVSSTSEPAEARARAERRWASRLEDLLDARPDLATDLQALVERAQAAAPASQGNVVQQANAHDQAQQAVQGHGTQHNTFNAPR
jgi:hypothetical protein